MKYHPEIDGLRAIAVGLVVLFHAELVVFQYGFLGVDVFFVISGYLITSIIVASLSGGVFKFADFYERRARRLFPALFVTVLCCIPFSWFVMMPNDLQNFGQSVFATVFFSNNILLAITSDYWSTLTHFKPLLHTWSLAVEEQFYLFYPGLLVLVFVATDKYLRPTLLFLFTAQNLKNK